MRETRVAERKKKKKEKRKTKKENEGAGELEYFDLHLTSAASTEPREATAPARPQRGQPVPSEGKKKPSSKGTPSPATGPARQHATKVATEE